ncbi:YbjQ family protein [Amycolatopsis sp. PS_44_ISF1]|uniref:YbjQ family protein n=1 Tax=Amycolatopsis sp. PS_44_ISF1 TaxID=2974917 RepID=UPI0028DE2EF5|nr:YbjQ family protein [Amycolatopsis sp. PS_44_ISF1]MDT8914235.1 YbjQ family protein [Amycolatopsis sp. PS_44_ISF1]
MTQPAPPQQFPILLSTMNDLPGYRVVRVFGEVFGLTVRSRNMFSNLGAGFKAMAGGELKGLSKLLSDSRYEALHRLSQEAMQHGANAVLALRFDCNEIAQTASEIAAYGTAVYVVPEGGQQPPAAQSQHAQSQHAQPQHAQSQHAQPQPGQPQQQQFPPPQNFPQG